MLLPVYGDVGQADDGGGQQQLYTEHDDAVQQAALRHQRELSCLCVGYEYLRDRDVKRGIFFDGFPVMN